MEVPFLGFTQPGDTYYLTPYSVYCFGMVNAAHLYNKGIHENQLGDHMHAHVYTCMRMSTKRRQAVKAPTMLLLS